MPKRIYRWLIFGLSNSGQIMIHDGKLERFP